MITNQDELARDIGTVLAKHEMYDCVLVITKGREVFIVGTAQNSNELSQMLLRGLHSIHTNLSKATMESYVATNYGTYNTNEIAKA